MSEVDGSYFHCFDTQSAHIAEPKPLPTDVCRAKTFNISTTNRRVQSYNLQYQYY